MGALRPSAVARVGQAVNVAVERFVTVGETIADDYPEVRQGMYEACKEARQAGKLLLYCAKVVLERFVWVDTSQGRKNIAVLVDYRDSYVNNLLYILLGLKN